MGGASLLAADCLAPEAIIIGLVALKENDASVGRNGIENDSQAHASLVRIGAANPRPGRFLAAGRAFDGVGDENGVVVHG